MALFLSTYVNKVDAKGRVSVPAPFRAAVGSDRFQGVILLRAGAHPCLEGFTSDYMLSMHERLEGFEMFSPAQDDLATALFGEAAPLPFDSEGRILLPAELCAYAGLDGQAAFVGLGGRFQVWSPEAFNRRREEARENVRTKGLTLPKGMSG